MIKHHPTQGLLKSFVDGDLPPSIAVIVASHVEMCEGCQQQIAQLTEQAAAKAFDLEDSSLTENDLDWADDALAISDDLSPINIIDNITALEADIEVTPPAPAQLQLKDHSLPMPRALTDIELAPWQGLGKISRARVQLPDDERRMSLLQIDKGGSIPHHTHKGFEITLLLEGSFEDEMGQYHKGDFMWLDGEHTHNPVTAEGCVCLTVSSNSLHFTQGVSQLLNPLGKLIY